MIHLITYDNSQTELNQDAIHKFITEGLQISDWWHYLPNTYMVASVRTATHLSNSLDAKFPGMRFLVIKVGTDSGDFNGRLNQKAWEWLAKPKKVLVKIKPSPTPPGLPLSTSIGLPNSKQPGRNALLEALSGRLPPKPPLKQFTLEELLKMGRK